MSATRASRLRVSTLNRVDLPTFGRPTRATTGSMAGASFRRSGRGQAIGADAALHVLDINGVAYHQRLRPDRLLGKPLARGQRTVAGLQPVHVALGIADHHVVALHGRSGEPAI